MFDTKRSRAAGTSRTRAITTSIALAVVCPLASLPVAPPASLHAVVSVATDSTPNAIAIVHPDFSGTWTEDTAASPLVDFAVTDSTIITQSENAISFDSRGRTGEGLPTHNWTRTMMFDGTRSTGVVETGTSAANIVAKAAWAGDTLVVTSYAMVGANDLLTFERMTLSSDGNTLIVRNVSLVNGRYQWAGPQTFVLRRARP